MGAVALGLIGRFGLAPGRSNVGRGIFGDLDVHGRHVAQNRNGRRGFAAAERLIQTSGRHRNLWSLWLLAFSRRRGGDLVNVAVW